MKTIKPLLCHPELFIFLTLSWIHGNKLDSVNLSETILMENKYKVLLKYHS